MQFGKIGKILAAGAMATTMAFSTVGFAALDDYPEPFVSGSNFSSLIVVGAAAAPSDVVGAIDLATRLGGETTSLVTVAGASGTIDIAGEGREVASGTTEVFLGDNLGKTGLRTTMTRDDLPNLLADDILDDGDASTTHKYTQFIKLTPSFGSAETYQLQFDRPGSSSSADPDYNFGRFPTSPTPTNYLYSTQVIFDKEVNSTTSIGEKLNVFGGTYTITSGTDFTASSPKLVLSGGSETIVLSGGETVTVTLEGNTYEITYVASSSATVGVVQVSGPGGTDQKSITEGTTTKIAGVDIFMDAVFDLSSTDLTQDSGKLLIGASKLTLTHGSKAKTGDAEDSVDGTLVNITTSSGKMSTLTIHHGGSSSDVDFLARGGSYSDNLWKTFSLEFPDVSPSLDAASRNTLALKPSGDNLVEATWTDDRGNEKTITWAYKASSTVTGFKLADNGGDNILVVENSTLAKDQYFVVDSGDFTHLFEVTGLTIDATSSAAIDIRDVFAGTNIKVALSSDNRDAKVIDGQTYNFVNVSSTTFAVQWGSGLPTNANNEFGVGTYLTVWPRMKGDANEFLHFTQPTAINLNSSTGHGTVHLQLPTGAINLVFNTTVVDEKIGVDFLATTNEDGTASACTAATCITNLTIDATGTSQTFTLGRTATGGLIYNVTVSSHAVINLTVVGGSGAVGRDQPSIVLVEQKDDNNNVMSVVFPVATETSGSNNVAIAAQPDFSHVGANETSLGSDSNILRAVDLFGTYTERKTSGQDTVTAWIPDAQVQAHVSVIGSDSTATIGEGVSGTTVRQAVPVKTTVAKLDTEVTSADRTTKHFILVGGPAVNTLVAELADDGSTWDVATYVDKGAGTAIIQVVSGAFASGKSALVVAGHSAADTRSVSSILQNFDAHSSDFAGKDMVEYKNGVMTTSAA